MVGPHVAAAARLFGLGVGRGRVRELLRNRILSRTPEIRLPRKALVECDYCSPPTCAARHSRSRARPVDANVSISPLLDVVATRNKNRWKGEVTAMHVKRFFCEVRQVFGFRDLDDSADCRPYSSRFVATEFLSTCSNSGVMLARHRTELRRVLPRTMYIVQRCDCYYYYYLFIIITCFLLQCKKCEK